MLNKMLNEKGFISISREGKTKLDTYYNGVNRITNLKTGQFKLEYYLGQPTYCASYLNEEELLRWLSLE